MYQFSGKNYENVFFTADEHYNSVRALRLSRRKMFTARKNLGFDEAAQTAAMNVGIIHQFNKVVGYNDLTFHIGDVGNHDNISMLHGDHVLIVGNYEMKDFEIIHKKMGISFEDWTENIKKKYGYVAVLHNFTFTRDPETREIAPFGIELHKDINKIFLTHEPIQHLPLHPLNSDGEENLKSYQMTVFGHIHEKCKIKTFGVNAGVDCNDYYPMSVDDVEFYLNAIVNGYYDENVFCN